MDKLTKKRLKQRAKEILAQQRQAETADPQAGAYAAAGREIFPAYGEAVDRLVARLNENGGGENAPRPGEVMPPFLLPAPETGAVTLFTSDGPEPDMLAAGVPPHWAVYFATSSADETAARSVPPIPTMRSTSS